MPYRQEAKRVIFSKFINDETFENMDLQGPPYIYAPIWGLAISKLADPGKRLYLIRKPWIMTVEYSYEIGSKYFVDETKRVLVKIVGLFLLHWTLTTRQF